MKKHKVAEFLIQHIPQNEVKIVFTGKSKNTVHKSKKQKKNLCAH